MSGRSWRLGRFLGVEVRIDSSWLLIFLLVTWTLAAGYFPQSYPGRSVILYWVVGLITSLAFFASVLIHELSHSVVARSQGEKVERITLFLFGGAAQISDEPRTALSEFTMALAGPLSSFVIAGVCAVLWLALRPIAALAGGAFYYLALINVGLGVFNLIPGFPLDGGRVFRSIIWGVTRNLRLATRIASWAGQTVAFLLVLLGVLQLFSGNWLNGLWIVMIGWFLRNAAVSSYRQLIVREAMADVSVSQLMSNDFVAVGPGLSLADLVEEYVIRRHEHAYPVVEGEQLVGIVCMHDVRSIPRERWEATTIREVMTPGPELLVVSPRDDGNTTLARMAAKDVHQLPVLDGARLVGMVSRSDVVRFLQWQSEAGAYTS
ncbi:MAG: site-2 protease family protein [Anaerolineae bacterium]